MINMKTALQLHTVRKLIAKDFWGTCQKIADLGYQGVELTDTRALLDATDLQTRLMRMGLIPVGVHVDLEPLESELDMVLEYYRKAGINQIVCPWLPENRRETAAAWMAMGRQLSAIGQQCRDRGFVFSYHNHAFEFAKFDGVYGLDLLLGHSDPQYLKWELDTYWVQFGGENPVAYMQRHAERISLLHVKDMAAGPDRKFAPVGAGVLDWRAIIAAANQAGIDWLIVEQDDCYNTPPLEVAQISLKTLRKLSRP